MAREAPSIMTMPAKRDDFVVTLFIKKNLMLSPQWHPCYQYNNTNRYVWIVNIYAIVHAGLGSIATLILPKVIYQLPYPF